MFLQMALFYILMTEQYSIVYMYHIFFIHSSVDGHLGCFHVLAIVNSAAINIRVHISFQIMVLSGYIPRGGEGTGNPLQCSCLENPRNRGAWWAAIHGIFQARVLEWGAIASSKNIVSNLLQNSKTQ